MEFREIKVEKLRHEYAVTASAQEYETRLNERLAEVGRTAKIPGFRPGKVPLPILKQRYESGVKAQVVERVVQLALEKLYKDKNLKPALKPDINFQSVDQTKNIEFTVSFDVLPVLDPLKLEEVTLERLTAEMPEAKLEEARKNLRERNRALSVPKEARPAQLGDVVTINFVGTCEGNLIPKGSGEGVDLELGSGTFIDTFEAQLVGKKVGDHVDVKVTFPNTYPEKKLAGKPAHFSVDITNLREYVTPEWDENFAEKLGFEKLADLDEAVKKQLDAECERMSFIVAKRNLLDFLDKHKFDIPESLMEIEFQTIWKHYLELQKSDPEALKQKSSSEKDEDQAQYRQIAERRVRLGLILADIGRRYEVSVTNKELEAALLTTMRRYPGQEKEVYGYFKNNPQALATLRAPIFEDKVVKLVLDKANITLNPVSYAELEKAVKDVTEGEKE